MHGRAFNRQEDIRKLQIFLAEMRNQGTQAGTFRFGDLMYEMHHPFTGFEEEADIRIWGSDEGGISGFVFFRPPDNPEFFIRPELYGSRMEDEMLSWTLTRAKERSLESIETSCLDTDAAKAAFLRRRGFTEGDEVCVLMERSLAEPLPAYRLPDGYSVVTIAERPELACWASYSPDWSMSREAYRHLQSAPGYKADMDVRAFYHDTELASECICWYDDVNNCGQFQPLRTQGEHRRKGLGSAVMTRAMENLRRYGADRVFVWTGKQNIGAVRFYQKLGFNITNEDYAWKRSIVE